MKFLSRRYDLPRSARQILCISGALAILLGATWGVNAANLSGPSNRAAQAAVRDVRERTQDAVRPPEAWRTEGRRASAQNKAEAPITASQNALKHGLHTAEAISLRRLLAGFRVS